MFYIPANDISYEVNMSSMYAAPVNKSLVKILLKFQ